MGVPMTVTNHKRRLAAEYLQQAVYALVLAGSEKEREALRTQHAIAKINIALEQFNLTVKER